MPPEPDQLADAHSGDAVTKAFNALHLALGDQHFSKAIIDRQTLHIPGAASGLQDGFPLLADIEQALEQGAILPDDLRVTSGRKILDLDTFRYVNRGKVEPQMLANAALMGSSIAINRLERHIPKAHRMARLIEEWLGDAVEFVLIASFGPEGAFLPHHDEEHAVIVQLDGAKHWTFLGNPVAPGAPMAMKAEPGPPRHLTINSGDVLYLPPGQRHICDAEGFSLHLSIMIQAPTGAVLQQRLKKAFRESILLQEPVPALLGPENDRRMAEEFRRHLHDLVDQLNIEQIFAQERRHLRIRPRVKLQQRER